MCCVSRYQGTNLPRALSVGIYQPIKTPKSLNKLGDILNIFIFSLSIINWSELKEIVFLQWGLQTFLPPPSFLERGRTLACRIVQLPLSGAPGVDVRISNSETDERVYDLNLDKPFRTEGTSNADFGSQSFHLPDKPHRRAPASGE
jgi:hypothetical protein